jgi:hypothetical protein
MILFRVDNFESASMNRRNCAEDCARTLQQRRSTPAGTSAPDRVATAPNRWKPPPNLRALTRDQRAETTPGMAAPRLCEGRAVRARALLLQLEEPALERAHDSRGAGHRAAGRRRAVSCSNRLTGLTSQVVPQRSSAIARRSGCARQCLDQRVGRTGCAGARRSGILAAPAGVGLRALPPRFAPKRVL